MALKIFVGEYVTGGGQTGHPDPDLLPEATMMVTRLVKDLTAIDSMEILLARDSNLPSFDLGVSEWLNPDWLPAIQASDAAWVIAPECQGILSVLTYQIEQTGTRLLGCSGAAIDLCSSKIETARHLSQAGIACLPTPEHCGHIPQSQTGWIAKPDDGVGATDMIATSDRGLLEHWLDAGRRASHLVQPHIEGRAASVTALFREGQSSVLSINSQNIRLSPQGCHYLGGIIGHFEPYRPQLTPIIDSIAKAIPGLWGPVGIDFLLTDEGPLVVEINPRLTTLWSGLGAALGLNPAQLVLDLAAGLPLPQCRPQQEITVDVGRAQA